ncbi:WXG100 family type VII secretion target [Saccharothrix hoggarensis]|uniref:WXG100 family type VII secretion target n=1 Tax=Saccharothrix hoggarensis TaxID=913853 RepID=A0ABW3QZW6_9PSEU
MNGFQTDLARLTEGAGDFTAFAERAGKIAGDLTGVLESIGDCWGGDAIGQSFAASHVQPSGDVLSGLAGLRGGFGGVGERFAETARTYRDVEDGNSTALGAI